MRNPRFQALALAVLLLAAACDDATTGAPAREPDVARVGPGEVLLGTVTCYVDVAAESTRCGEPAGRGGASQTRVALSSTQFSLITGVSFTSGGIANFFNKIQNNLGQEIGTHNGINSDSIRAFVTAINVTGGSGTVTANNPTGTGTFTAPNQPYWLYSEIVAPNGGQTATTLIWKFNVPGTVTAWNYTVGVSAPIAHPNGWVEVTGDDQIPHGQTRTHTATVYDWTGAVDNTGTVAWDTVGVSGSVYAGVWDSRTALILGVRPGTAEVTASKGSATPHTYGVEVIP